MTLGHLLAAAIAAPLLMTPGVPHREPRPSPSPCPAPYRVSRDEILRAMAAHGSYSLTATTTSMRFGAETLLELVRRRQREAPESTRLFIDQSDWFTAHRETAGATYGDMSEAARAGFEHHQDALVDYGPHIVEQVVEGPAPKLALDVTIFWPNAADAPSAFSYTDTLSVPRVQVHDRRVIRFKLVAYEDMLLFDQIDGISVKPLGLLSAIFAVVGKPDLQQTRVAVSRDQWQVMAGKVKLFPGVSRTGIAAIAPDGRGQRHIPGDRPDLEALEQRIERPVKLRYGAPSCALAT